MGWTGFKRVLDKLNLFFQLLYPPLSLFPLSLQSHPLPFCFFSFLNLQKHTEGRSCRGMLHLGKKQIHCVSVLVPMFPDRMGIKETGNIQGVQVCSAPLPRFNKPEGGFAGVYYQLGTNIQSGVVSVGENVAMTEMKRKRGPGNPQEHRREKKSCCRTERERQWEADRSERLKRWKKQREGGHQKFGKA